MKQNLSVTGIVPVVVKTLVEEEDNIFGMLPSPRDINISWFRYIIIRDKMI